MSQRSGEPEEPFELLGALDDEPGPARPLSPQQASALVRGALDVAFSPPPPVAPAPKPWYARRAVWMTGAGLAVVGAVAVGVWSARQPPPPVPPVPREAEVKQAPPPPVVREEAPPPPEAAPVAEAPAPTVPETRPAPRPTAEPEDLLRRANERRAQGQWRAAESLYQRVLQASPGTESAYVALVASGGLRLEHLGDARGALRQYQQALRLRPAGSLSEEARHGVARAWRALGDTVQEKRALEDFLAAHPDSLRAESAKHRLAQLSAAPQ